MKTDKLNHLYRTVLLMFIMTVTTMAASSAPQLRAFGHIVGNFSRLDIAGTMNVDCRYNPDSTGYVVLHTFPEFSKVLQVRNDNGVLRLWTDADNIGAGYIMNVTVYSDALEKIDNGAAGRVTVSSIRLKRNSVFELKNNATGVCTINAPVTAKTISIRNTGQGDLVINRPLEAQKVTITSRSNAAVYLKGLSAVDVVIDNHNNAAMEISDIQATDISVTNRSGGNVSIQRSVSVTMSVRNNDGGNIHVTGIENPCVSADNNGTGTITLAGTAVEATVHNNSTGTIDTSELATGQQE